MLNHARSHPAMGFVVALIVSAVVLAGCSSSDDDESSASSTSPPSSSEETTARGSKEVPDGVEVPLVSGPVTGGIYPEPFNTMPPEIAEEYDYVEDEYFLEGTATAYVPEGELASDGAWSLTEGETAPYTTRILVRKPADPAAFNGTVLVEWLNVSGGIDADPHFGMTYPALLEDGFGYVGISAQATGIEGGGFQLDIPGIDPQPLKEFDPERYGELSHPGDDYSYDLFTQAGAVAAGGAELDPFEGYAVERLLAAGESQSALRLVAYINGVHPLAGIFDGFLVHSRGAGAAPIVAEASDQIASTEAVFIRTDLDVPVLTFQTETDILGVLSFLPARQPDTELLRTWEVAGTAHADQATLDYGIQSGQVNQPDAELDFSGVCGDINTGPQRYVVRRAIVDLDRWVRDGTAPVQADPIEVENDAIVRDEYGNALGGIRTPTVEVPIATQSGDPTPGANLLCSLFGHRIDFDDATLAGLYDGSADYVEQVTAAAAATVEAGFLLPEDEARMVADAEAVEIPG